jgi:hypothetical protein
MALLLVPSLKGPAGAQSRTHADRDHGQAALKPQDSQPSERHRDASETFGQTQAETAQREQRVRRAGVPAMLALAVLSFATGGCYWGFGAGPTYPNGTSPSSSGANSLTDVGLVFDYRRVVRVMYARSFQMFGGAVYTAGGQSVVAPLENELEVQVTVRRLSELVYLRAMARGMVGSNVRVGPTDHEIEQPGHRALGAMLGASLLVAADHEGLGPTGLIVSAGVLVGRTDTGVLGSSSFVAPMVLVGFDFFPPLLVRCLLWDDSCPSHIKLGASK